MAKQVQKMARYAIQNETKRNISTSPHSKQNKCFLATTTGLNSDETSKYTYELLLTYELLIKTVSLKEYFFTQFSAGA